MGETRNSLKTQFRFAETLESYGALCKTRYNKSYGRCIAINLIEYGKSSSPDIEFSAKDHPNYLAKLIDKLNLKDM
jgi:hypothetical protein